MSVKKYRSEALCPKCRRFGIHIDGSCHYCGSEIEENKYINFGDMCRRELGIQCQYGSRYVDGAILDYPNLGDGLRFKGNTNLYHSLKIHYDDVDEFVRRVKSYRDF